MRATRQVQVRTVTGVCSAIGGIAWVAACFVHNSLPQGCIGDQCGGGNAMRGSSPVDTTLFVVAGLMLASSGMGLLVLAHRRAGSGRLGVLAGISAGLGLVLLAAAGVVSIVDNNWNGMPGLVIPGVLLLVLGLVLVAAVVLRAHVVPVWVAALLLGTALLLLFANEQTSRILLAVPFGIAWLTMGVVLLRTPAGQGSRPPAFALEDE